MKKSPLLLLVLFLVSAYVQAQTARLQIIHNSAAKDAKLVDVWIEGSEDPLLSNFKFRSASPFVDAPAGKELTIQIKAPNSKKEDVPLFEKKATLTDNKKYIVVANGIIGSGDYNPGADKAPFDLFVFDLAKEAASKEGNTDVAVFHGATDAPNVNVAEVSVPAGTIIENLGYTKFTAGYLELASQDYSLQVRTTGNDVVAQYKAPLSGLKNSATMVVASGFLDPRKNENGPAFGLFAALPTGGDLVELPAEKISTARLQIIHNSADKAAVKVDIRVNGGFPDKSFDDFAFRTATPFLDVPAATKLKVTINAPDSEDDSQAIFTQEVEFEAGKRYLVVANGIVSATGYEPGADKAPFNLAVFANAKEMASNAANVDVLVYHGSTDAPIVDITEKKIVKGKVIENLAYNKFNSAYLPLPEDNYEIGIEAEGNEVAAYLAPLKDLKLAGNALSIVASGFLNPSKNSEGPAFGLWVANAVGGPLIELPLATFIKTKNINQIIFSTYPNPASEIVNVEISEGSNNVSVDMIEILDLSGKVIQQNLFDATTYPGIKTMNISELENGIYFIRLKNDATILGAKKILISE